MSVWSLPKCLVLNESCAVCVGQLNNRLFEELAMDVYDEVDRRENDAGESLALTLALSPLFPLPPISNISHLAFLAV